LAGDGIILLPQVGSAVSWAACCCSLHSDVRALACFEPEEPEAAPRGARDHFAF
jgi:hypothetical protein